MLEGYYIKKIGQNKGSPRVWLEGTQTARAGFEAGQRYDIVVKGQTVVLQANKDGSRTAVEHARIKGVPEHLIDGLSNTVGHEVLGQSVIYAPFKDLGQHIGNALNRFSNMPEIELANRAGADTTDHIADLANEVVATLRMPNENGGRYSGPIVAVDGNVQIQSVGRNEGVVHITNQLDITPKLGQTINIAYDKGRGTVVAREKHQYSLGL